MSHLPKTAAPHPAPPPKPFRIFDVDDRYRKMASRPGGPRRDLALRQAQLQIEQQKPQFDAWLDESLKALSDLVAGAATGQAEEKWAHAAAEHARNLHDIAKTLDLEILASVAHALWTVLDAALRHGGEIRVNALQRHIEAATLARGHVQRGLPPERLNEMDESLRAVVARAARSPAKA